MSDQSKNCYRLLWMYVRMRRTITPMTSSAPQGWVAFERLVAAVQKRLDKASTVGWNERVAGKSGTSRQLDVVVRGRVGTAPIFIVVECKDYTPKVGIDLVEAFLSKLEDVGAHKGIMVARSGFTRDALARAERAGIIPCVLRPARDEDWEGYLRSMRLQIASYTTVLENLTLDLTNGETVATSAVAQIEGVDGKRTFLDYVVKGWLAENPRPDGQPISLDLTPPPLLLRDEGEVRILRVRFCPRRVEAFTTEAHVSRPEDWVFVREHVDGRVDDEKQFFVFSELAELSETFAAG
jgi:hypothetical protein